MMIYNKATGELVPWLATQYQWSDDNLTLTFTIRQNVKWSDGEPFTAKDVVYTYNLLQNNEALTGTATSVLAEYIDSFSAPDDSTVSSSSNRSHPPSTFATIVVPNIWKDVHP